MKTKKANRFMFTEAIVDKLTEQWEAILREGRDFW